MASTFIGKVPEFGQNDDYATFEERLLQHFIAIELKDEVRKAGILLTVITEEVYRNLRNLCFPKKPSELTFKELCKHLGEFYAIKVSVFRERVKFYDAKQFGRETTAEWLTRVKHLATNCNFKDNLKAVLRDKFVTGLVAGPIADRVMEEEPDADLAVMYDVAIKKETSLNTRKSEIDINKISYSSKVNTVNRQNIQPKIDNVSTKTSNSSAVCFACGKSNHVFKFCKFKKQNCDKCGKRGHVKEMCESVKNFTNRAQQNKVDSRQRQNFLEIFNINEDNNNKPFMLTVLINNIPVEMEMDSGASVTAISEQFFNTHFSSEKLVNPGQRLKSYNGVPISTIGYFVANIKCDDFMGENMIMVVRNGGRPLLGRDLLRKCNITFTKAESKDSKFHKVLTIDSNPRVLLSDIIARYDEMFSDKLGRYRYETINLQLKDDVKPVFFKPRQVPHAFREKVNQELDRLQSEGIISHANTSEWGTPLVPVLKKNGDIRVCADYRITVNKFLKDINYPIPLIDDLFAALEGGQKFTKLDLSSAYNQIELDEETKHLLAWSTTKGVFIVNRLPFGTKPASSIFQNIMEKTLLGVKGTVVLLDDILITGKSDEEHLANLEAVFMRLSDAGFKLRKEKCSFFQAEVRYLGYVIDAKGLHKDADKIKAIVNAPKPQNITQTRAFIGLVNYYGKFVPNLADVLNPLYKLLQKNTSFRWNESCQRSFDQIKEIMTSENFLVHFNPRLPVKLITDASLYGVGAVLVHVFPDGEERPIAYASRTLTKPERNYAMIHKEALAIYFGVKKFSNYLIGRHFILCTDHKPLVTIFGPKKGIPEMAAGRLQRWSVYLSAYDFTIQHIKGEVNKSADFLSRLPVYDVDQQDYTDEDNCSYLNFVNMELDDLVDVRKIRAESRNDKILSKVIYSLRFGWPNHNSDELLKPFFIRRHELSLENGIIMWGYRIVIPTKYRINMLNELHTSHLGMSKMKALARAYFWWPNLDADIEKLVRSCEICLQARPEEQKTPLTPWIQTIYVFQRIHVDFCGPIRGKYFLIILDSYSKWVEVYMMTSCDARETIERLRECFARYDVPNSIVSDNGGQFTAAIYEEFCKLNGINLVLTAPYSPASNGAAENAVRTFKSGLIKSLKDHINKDVSLTTLINRYLYYYRRTEHSTTKETPYKKMFDRASRMRFNQLLPNVIVKKNIERQVRNYNIHTKPKIFKIAEEVMARDYRSPLKKTWVPAVIKKCVGKALFLVETKEGFWWRRHSNQLMKRIIPENCNMFQRRSTVTDQQDRSDFHEVMDNPQSVARERQDEELEVIPVNRVNEQGEQAVEEQSQETVQLRRSTRTRKEPIRLDL